MIDGLGLVCNGTERLEGLPLSGGDPHYVLNVHVLVGVGTVQHLATVA